MAIRKKPLNKLTLSLTDSQLKVIGGVLMNLAAGWFGSILIFPGLVEIVKSEDFSIILIYSVGFGILSMIIASIVEGKIYDR